MTPAMMPTMLLTALCHARRLTFACWPQHNSDIPHQLLQRCISSPACQPYLLHEFLGQRLELARLRNLVAQHEPCLAQPTACLKDMTLTSNQVWGGPQ